MILETESVKKNATGLKESAYVAGQLRRPTYSGDGQGTSREGSLQTGFQRKLFKQHGKLQTAEYSQG